MLFNSLEFFVFFPLVVGIYYAIPHRVRWGFLLAVSYYFYACWRIESVFLILFSTAVAYYTARVMETAKTQQKKKQTLLLSLVINLGILFFYKYFNFFNESLRLFLNQFNILYSVSAFDLLLPVGISFYTFQLVSYSIDVYQGELKAEKHFGILAFIPDQTSH